MHSNKDIVVMAISVFLVEQHLPEAQLVIYPDASLTAAEVFLEHARLFLNGEA